MRILVVSAHHDDLEVGCGAAVARWLEMGHQLTSLVFTHSGYQAPDGRMVRTREAAGREAQRAARTLGYDLVGYEEDTFDVTESDENVCKILRVIRERQIDTLLTHWHGDTHPPHQRIHRMALHAARNLPRALGFSVNWYIGAAPFVPNLFVPVDETHWSRKLQALRCYESECERAGERWSAYLDRQSLNYGVQMGVSRAEAFIAYKYLWES